jgi:hypothetical protein
VLEHHAEIVAKFHVAVRMTVPPLPPAFQRLRGYGHDSFRRGFLHSVTTSWTGNQVVAEEHEVDAVCAALPN